MLEDSDNLFLEAVGLAVSDPEMFGPSGACPALLEPGDPASRLVVVTGDNAGGKSLVCRFARSILARSAKEDGAKVEFIHVGMELRTQGGMARAFVFGDESWESTGQISCKAVLGGIRTSRGREHAHVLSFDEPDIGLSEGYQAALGEELAAYAADLPAQALGALVVTHSRPIVSRLVPLRPHLVRVGDDLRPTARWLAEGPLPRTREDLEGLQARAHERFLAVSGIQDARKAKRKG